MIAKLKVLSAGPGLTMQDSGRPGWLAAGLSQGGAMDRDALAEGNALLGQAQTAAALEMAGMGGTFEVLAPLRIALTGALMTADQDGDPLHWNAGHTLPTGARLHIGPARRGNYGYLHVGGGFAGHEHLGSQSAHLLSGIGRPIEAGEILSGPEDAGHESGMVLQPEDRHSGGTIRVVASVQTDAFSDALRARFFNATFTRHPNSTRQAIRLSHDGDGFSQPGMLNTVSEIVTPGDIQIAGNGDPYILMRECQTMGGYPRIATAIPCDLSRVAQTPVGTPIRFQLIDFETAITAERKHAGQLPNPKPLLRAPGDVQDLLSYQLISGAIRGDEET